MTTRASVLGLILCLFALFSAPVSAGGAPIQDFLNVPVPTKVNGAKMSMAEVQAAIFAACAGRTWTPRLDAPGRITATILVRQKHYAEVTIDFSETNYSIKYVTSRDLDYNEAKRTIHGNYNKWVGLLSSAIQQGLATLVIAPPPAAAN